MTRILSILLLFARFLSADTTAADFQGKAWEFVASGGNATLTAYPGNFWHVTIDNVNPEVLSFTDRPERLARRISMEHLVTAWPELFGGRANKEIPPNAALLSMPRDGRPPTKVAFSMTDPTYNPNLKQFSFLATPIEENAIFPGGYQYDQVALFIDSAGASTGIGVLNPVNSCIQAGMMTLGVVFNCWPSRDYNQVSNWMIVNCVVAGITTISQACMCGCDICNYLNLYCPGC